VRAAKDLGRRAIGIEVNPDYCAMAVRRLAQLALPLAV
jgi:DNA modification methylase